MEERTLSEGVRGDATRWTAANLVAHYGPHYAKDLLTPVERLMYEALQRCVEAEGVRPSAEDVAFMEQAVRDYGLFAEHTPEHDKRARLLFKNRQFRAEMLLKRLREMRGEAS